MIIRKLDLILNGRIVSSNNTLIPDFRKADYEGLRKQLQRLRGVRSEVGQDPGQGGALISGEVTSQVSKKHLKKHFIIPLYNYVFTIIL